MDGPNVNWKFFDMLNTELSGKFDTSLLEIDCCGLHVVHGAFQTGHKAVRWNMNSVLRSFDKLFHDSSARRGDYIEITDSNIFPKKFCSVRWVENASVAQRTLDIYNNIKKYVEKSRFPSNFTVKTVKESVGDPLTPCRISFFINIATVLEPFLRYFQSDAPLVPFFI